MGGRVCLRMRAFDYCLRWTYLGGRGRAWPEKGGCSCSPRHSHRRRLEPMLAPPGKFPRNLRRRHLEHD